MNRRQQWLVRRRRALAGVAKLAVSPDGRNVYAAAFTSDAVAAFAAFIEVLLGG